MDSRPRALADALDPLMRDMQPSVLVHLAMANLVTYCEREDISTTRTPELFFALTILAGLRQRLRDVETAPAEGTN